MIAFPVVRRALAKVIKRAGNSGFASLVIDGFDVDALIAEERKSELLTLAVEHARRHNEPFWMEKCARRLAEIAPSPEARLSLALVLSGMGKLDEAESLLRDLPAAQRAGDAYFRTRAVCGAKRGLAEEALADFDRLGGGLAGHYPAPVALATAEEMIRGCPLVHTAAFIGLLRARYPRHMLIRSLQVRCLAYNGDVEQARELATVPVHELADVPQYERRQLREAAALILSLAGWNNELLDLASDALKDDPAHWSLYYQAAEAASYGARHSDYDRIIERLPAELARSPDAMAVRCRWLVDKGHIAEAMAVIEDLRPRSPASFLNATLYLAISHGRADAVEKAYEDCMRAGVAPLGPALSYGMYLYYFTDDGPARALDLLARCRSVAENNVAYWQLNLRCLIGAGKRDEARSLYGSLARGVQRSARLQPFAMYFDAEDGRHAAATKGWSDFIRRSRHVCVNGKTSYPQTVLLRYVDKPGQVLLFANVFNGAIYLDWFLEHYRKLGVDHFFITDNASGDGTFERLARESDVSLFTCPDSFASSAFGIVWTNHQMQRFGVGHWCFHVDFDEGFVFPGHDRGRSLRNLLAYLDHRAYGVVAAVELDMYPEQLDKPVAGSLFAAHRYFDASYRSMRIEIPPYVLLRGGVRQRMTGLALTMTKAPLVRVSPEFRYIECNHYTTHLPVADVTAALLHYKFVGDVAGRLKEAIDRGVHFGGALAYRRLRSAAEDRGWSTSLLSDASRPYEGVRSLEAAGIIESSRAWEAFTREADQPAR